MTGPADNLGESLIRRATLDWARYTSDELVVYTGEAPDLWLRQLGVPTGVRVLRSKRTVPRWLWQIATAPSRPVLVFEAGDVPLDRGDVLRELVFLAETLIVRLKRGVVVRPPRGVRATSQPAACLHARAARLGSRNNMHPRIMATLGTPYALSSALLSAVEAARNPSRVPVGYVPVPVGRLGLALHDAIEAVLAHVELVH